jgi:hypothetical protein
MWVKDFLGSSESWRELVTRQISEAKLISHSLYSKHFTSLIFILLCLITWRKRNGSWVIMIPKWKAILSRPPQKKEKPVSLSLKHARQVLWAPFTEKKVESESPNLLSYYIWGLISTVSYPLQSELQSLFTLHMANSELTQQTNVFTTSNLFCASWELVMMPVMPFLEFSLKECGLKEIPVVLAKS